jgi:hypothetical protein
MSERIFSEADLEIGSMSEITKEQDVFTHTHTVVFGRPLTQAERHLFASVLTGFYYTVHFSRQFGDGLVAEPVVDFDAPNRARYTLKQTTLSGPWKDLLLAILANFSHEVAPIIRHDESRAFDPERTPTLHET